jgi:hypothetical protein
MFGVDPVSNLIKLSDKYLYLLVLGGHTELQFTVLLLDRLHSLLLLLQRSFV